MNFAVKPLLKIKGGMQFFLFPLFSTSYFAPYFEIKPGQRDAPFDVRHTSHVMHLCDVCLVFLIVS